MSGRMSGRRVGHYALRAISAVVPAERRREWLEEWEAELEALQETRATRRARDYPSALAFVAGALPHALWTRRQEWTLDGVLQDLRFAGRKLRRAPGFTAVASLTLAIGIGANAAIFTLVNGLVWRAPPGIAEPERLVQVARSYDQAPRWDNWSAPALALIGREARVFSGVAGYQGETFVIGRGAATESVSGQLVTGGYFDVLGVRPHVGRLLRSSDDIVPGAHPVLVLSYDYWTRRYGGDASVVGRTVLVGARPYEVVGVAPPGFAGPGAMGAPPEIWVPAMQHPGYDGELPFEDWGTSWINGIGRLQDGVSFEQARAAMDVVTAVLRAADPVNEDIRILLAPGVGLDPAGRAEAERLSLLLFAIVGFVLLVTCTNVANLCLARAAGRRTEVAVRTALGAGRARLWRQLVTESLLLALLAAALAVPVVHAAGSFLPLLVPYALAVPLEPDARVYAFLAAVGLITGLLFGAAPAWAAARRDMITALREGATTPGRAHVRLRDALLVVQLALSLGLITGAALLGRSVARASAADPGFAPGGLLAGFVDPRPTGRYDDTSATDLYRRLLAEVERLPGVVGATLANQTPLIGGHSRATVAPVGGSQGARFEAEYVLVGPDYFRTMGIPLVRGRPLGGVDDEPERVVVVNEALARMFWPGEDPLGRQLDGARGTWRVVGVAGDVQMRSLRSPAMPAVFYPLAHAGSSRIVVHVRTRGAPLALAGPLRDAVATVDPELPVTDVVDLHQAMAGSLGETRTIGLLVSVFAAITLALGTVGLYGLVSYAVARRVREIGIRIALGARPAALARGFLARGVGIALVGIAAGVGLSILLGRALQGLLFDVAPSDPVTLGGAALVLLATAALAAWIPARRATRIDAAISLREGRALSGS